RTGVRQCAVDRRRPPDWTTDWLAPGARQKLNSFAIAPPVDGTAASGRLPWKAARLADATQPAVACPRCQSTHTENISQFGSTPCKASFRCKDCLEPFEYFKCI